MWLKTSAATLLVLSVGFGPATLFSTTANAAEAPVAGSRVVQGAPPPPPAMPVISRNVPAYTNDNCGGATSAAWADDANYDYGWRSCNTPSTAAPTYLAYDLSGVPATNRGPILVVWYNDPATLVYDFTYKGVHPYPPGCTTNCGWTPYDIPKDYTIEANAAPGGTLPTSGWVALVTVTGNKYHSRQHAVDFTGYNWLRLNVTDTFGTTNAFGVVVNMDVHDASAGLQDDWIFYGDSITEGSMDHYGGTGTFGQMINAALPSRFPAQEAGAIGGTLSRDGVNSIGTWLPMFAGKYVVIAYGTNDAGYWEADNFSAQAFYNNYATMIQAVTAVGKTPVIPKIPWSCGVTHQKYIPTLNQQIDALYAAYPQVVKGPDLFAFFQSNQSLIGSDCVHPTDSGYYAMRKLWADTMLSNVYAPPPPPPALSITNVQVGSITPTSAVVSWQTSNPASSRVDYGTTTTYDSSVIDATSVTSHSLSLPGLTPGTTYHYQVSSVDSYNQTATTPDATFATTPAGGQASRFVLATTASPNSGVPFSFTVTAQDASGNTATGYTGTVHFTSTDTSTGVALPADATLTSGQGTFSATLVQAGAQTITATDTVTAMIKGTLNVTVRPASAAIMTLTVPSTVTALQPFNVTVTLKDRFGNVATGYTGKVTFTSSDLLATLPADYTFTAADAGTRQFSVTLATPPSQTISVHDVANSSLGTTSRPITVSLGVGLGL
jgi:lysophospholipase L1-like esterase